MATKKITPEKIEAEIVADVSHETLGEWREEELTHDEATDAVVYEKPAGDGEVIATDGDTYASLAAKLKPKGMSGFEYATVLLALNGGKKISAGSVVRLK